MESTTNQSLALSDAQGGIVPKNQPIDLQTLDLTQPLPDLDAADVMPLDLMSDYWTPDTPGEQKRVVFVKLDQSPVQDHNNVNNIVQIPCAFFLEKTAQGEVRQIRNGSKRLVSAIEAVVTQGFVQSGTPLLITYLGEKKNLKGSFKSHNWSIKPLKLNIG